MLKWIKKLILDNSKISELPGEYSDYNNILNTKFHSDIDFDAITKDLIKLIVTNDFVVNPAQIIMIYKDKYDFSINEFLILLFKLGMVSKLYIDNPKALVQSAIVLLKNELSDETMNVLYSINAEYSKTEEPENVNEDAEKQEIKDIEDILRRMRSDEHVDDEEVNRVIDYWKKKKED